MTIDQKDVDQSVERLGDKARTLNDSLKTLSNDGFDKLSRAVGQAAVGNAPGSSRKPAGDIVGQELAKLLQREVSSGFKDMMTGGGASASSGFSVIINNNTGAAVAAQKSTDGMDQKQLEISIDQMVANSLVRGRQTSGVMRTLFGIAPGLIGR